MYTCPSEIEYTFFDSLDLYSHLAKVLLVKDTRDFLLQILARLPKRKSGLSYIQPSLICSWLEVFRTELGLDWHLSWQVDCPIWRKGEYFSEKTRRIYTSANCSLRLQWWLSGLLFTRWEGQMIEKLLLSAVRCKNYTNSNIFPKNCSSCLVYRSVPDPTFGTPVGVSLSIVSPVPSCPNSFLPQHSTPPPLSTAHVWEYPAARATTPGCGGDVKRRALSQSEWIKPGHIFSQAKGIEECWGEGNMGCSDRAVDVCVCRKYGCILYTIRARSSKLGQNLAPAVSPVTPVGVSLHVVSPVPSCPSSLSPQQSTPPPLSTAHVW